MSWLTADFILITFFAGSKTVIYRYLNNFLLLG